MVKSILLFTRMVLPMAGASPKYFFAMDSVMRADWG